MQCKAKSKQSGERCKKHAVPTYDVCHIHGGKTPRGIALPQTKHGRYSKYLPVRLQERYETALSDSELLAMREEIALLDSRLADLLQRVDTGEAGRLWGQAQEAYERLQKAIDNADKGELLASMRKLSSILGSGANDYAAWTEVQAVIDQRRRLAESERKRLIELEQVVTSQEAMLVAQALLESVKRNVTSREILGAIQNDFIQIVNFSNRERVTA